MKMPWSEKKEIVTTHDINSWMRSISHAAEKLAEASSHSVRDDDKAARAALQQAKQRAEEFTLDRWFDEQ